MPYAKENLLRENNGRAKSFGLGQETAKVRTAAKASEFESCVALTKQKYDSLMLGRSVNNALSALEIGVTSCRNVLEPEHIEALKSRLSSRDVLAIRPRGFGKN